MLLAVDIKKIYKVFINFLNEKQCKINSTKALNKEKCLYINAGKFLGCLYALNMTEIKKENIKLNGMQFMIEDFTGISIKNSIYSFSSEEIAQEIINSSVYNIVFLPEDKKNLEKHNVEHIKMGFKEVYNCLLDNKVELVNLLNETAEEEGIKILSIIAKINMLNIRDMNSQFKFIDARFNNIGKGNKLDLSSKKREVKLNENLVEVCSNIADYIIEKGIIGCANSTMERTWIEVVEDNKVSIIGKGLYSGNAGVALFLASLSVVTKKEYYLSVALEAMVPAIRYLENISSNETIDFGAFNGISSIFYTLSKLYKLTGDNKFKELIKEHIDIFYKYSSHNCINVSNGSAGVIAVLSTIHKDMEDDLLKLKIEEIVSLLYKNIIKQADLLELNEELNLGFEYGLSGVIAYLQKLTHMKNLSSVEKDIAYLLKIERYLNSKAKLNNKCSNHISGILLSRLMLKESGYKDEVLDEEIKALLKECLDQGLGENPYYGKGQLGNLEILDKAAEILNHEELKNRCLNTYNTLIKHNLNKANYDLCNISLINGLSGIGYSLILKYNENLPRIIYFS